MKGLCCLIVLLFTGTANATLLTNGGFTGSLAGWSTIDQAKWVSDGGGRAALSKGNTANVNGTISQNFTLDPGSSSGFRGLEISFDYLFKNWADNDLDALTAWVKIRTTNVGNVDFSLLNISSNPGSIWKTVTAFVDLSGLDPKYSQSNVAGIYFKVKDHNSASNAYAKIDNVDVRGIPEPATLALLGLGLAGIGFSRKKKAA